jgi:flagellar export protein FliJ
MKRFRFALDPVLKLAARRDLEVRIRIAGLTGELRSLHNRDDLLAAASTYAAHEASLAGPASRMAGAYLAVLSRARRDVAREISRASAMLGETRSQWRRVHREKRSLERLRDLRAATAAAAMARKEQQDLEELTAMRIAVQGAWR